MTASRRALVLPLLVPLLAGLTGCGGSDDKDGTSSGKAPTRAQAEAAAKAINLTKADMSGYASDPADNSGGADSTDKELASCLGVSDTEGLVDLSSDGFSKGQPPSGSQVSSNVEVVASTDDAKSELAAFSGDKAPGCLQKVLGAGLKAEVDQPGVTLGELKAVQAEAAQGTDGAFAYTLTTEASALGIKVPIVFTVDGFLVKHSEVSLLTVTYGSASADGERKRVLDLLVERAKDKAV